MRIFAISAFFSVLGTGAAFAHGGHVGDLAGHSHWVGWAAAAAAGAVAAWAIKRGNKSKTAGKSASDETDSGKQPEASEV